MLLSDPPHSLNQAQKKIMTQCSSNYTKWESFISHHSLCCALSALQPPQAGRGSTIPLQQCWITQDGRGSQTLPPLKFLFSLLGTTLLIALPCRFCSLPSVTSRLQLQEVPRSEVCQMYASPASPFQHHCAPPAHERCASQGLLPPHRHSHGIRSSQPRAEAPQGRAQSQSHK